MNFNIIVAHCKNNGIGFDNNLPWKISSDLKKFKQYTVGNNNNAVIMGKNTWLSIKTINCMLKNRDNLILSTTLNIDESIDNNIIKSFNNIEVLNNFLKIRKYDEVWIIGGEKIYNYFLDEHNINSIYTTYIDKEFECDTYFPKIDFLKYKFISQTIHKTHEPFDYQIFDRVYKLIDT